jgi:ribosomal protein L11 methyltransferase
MTLKATLVAAFAEARRISNFLERDYGDSGAVVSLDERPDGLWSVDVYFERNDPGILEAELRDWLGADAFGAPLSVELLPERDWVAAGLEALPPVRLGRFVVYGSHSRHSVPAGRIGIEIEAAQAFGTGHHATTAGCLLMLDQLLRSRLFRNPLDLGTGSGILAIALAKLLRRPVLATDIDPVATCAATANVRLNGVGQNVRVVTAAGIDHPTTRAAAPFDLVVANVLAEPLCLMAPQLSRLIVRGGTMLLSGLLRQQQERVTAAYVAQGFRVETTRAFDGWIVLVLRRR